MVLKDLYFLREVGVSLFHNIEKYTVCKFQTISYQLETEYVMLFEDCRLFGNLRYFTLEI